jgi:hypothetical protein
MRREARTKEGVRVPEKNEAGYRKEEGMQGAGQVVWSQRFTKGLEQADTCACTRKRMFKTSNDIEKKLKKQGGRQADKQTGRKADRQTSRQADKQTSRQAE